MSEPDLDELRALETGIAEILAAEPDG